jgi:hypothetical protein
MKKINLVLVLLVAAFGFQNAAAQNNGIAKSLGLYVFPSKDQDVSTQNTDEAFCYAWAKEQTGYDPLNPPTVQAAPVNNAPDGSAVKGAAGGAAAGAAIGAIAGDAGKGAAIGAITGALRGRRASVQGKAAQSQSNQQAAANQSAALLNDYKKAFSVCMEGKGYTIK